MIIDAILDRRAENREDRTDSWGHEDYEYLREEADMFGYEYLTEAIASANEECVKDALCRYIDEEGYDPSFKEYVLGVDWIPEEE